jgi:putative endonuclease
VSTKQFCVYFMTNKLGGAIYTGVTSRLLQRVYEHREGLVEGFTKRYGLKTLVYYEVHATAESAITREKQLKDWQRRWKVELLERENPNWIDLYPRLSL